MFVRMRMQARMLHEAWRANATDVEQRLPHSVALLRHPTRAALAREFARASACLLRHQGGPGAAALQGAGDLDTLAASVLTWPQVMSYDTPERMPTGRETSLPRTVMRGVFIAREVGSVMIDTYDPRGPLDSMEIQDTVNDMYKCVLDPCSHHMHWFHPLATIDLCLAADAAQAACKQWHTGENSASSCWVSQA